MSSEKGSQSNLAPGLNPHEKPWAGPVEEAKSPDLDKLVGLLRSQGLTGS